MASATPILYLDAAATTPTDPGVQAAVLACLREPPQAQRRLEVEAYDALQRILGTSKLTLTTGGTAANALAIRTAAYAGRSAGRTHLLSQPTEHPSVLRLLEHLGQREGFEVEWLPVSDEGRVDPRDVRAALRPDTALVSIMRANHETGAIQPTPAIGDLCRAAGVPFHVDAVQSSRFLPESIDAHSVDLLTLSAHKLSGPKGVGLLATRTLATPRVTDRPEAVVGLARALALRVDVAAQEATRVARSRDTLEQDLRAAIPCARVNGRGERLPGHLNLSFPGVSGEAIVLDLDQDGIAASSGAACASGKAGPSPVLRAMGRSEAEATGSIRLSLFAPLDREAHTRIVTALSASVERLHGLSGRMRNGR